MKFRLAIFEKSSLDADFIAQDECCELGKWLQGDDLARAINAMLYREAASMLKPAAPYTLTSSALGLTNADLLHDISQSRLDSRPAPSSCG